MLTIAHPLTPQLLNLAFVFAERAATATATTIAPPPCSSSAQKLPASASAAPGGPFPANRFASPARFPTATLSAPESVCPPVPAEISLQNRASERNAELLASAYPQSLRIPEPFLPET